MSIILTPEFLTSISPDTHKRYSPNFHKWLSRHSKKLGAEIGVYRSEGNAGAGFLHVGSLQGTETTTGKMMIYGSHIMSILQYDNRGIRPQPRGHLRHWQEEANWFSEYQRIGRCLLDPRHDMWISREDEEARWVYSEPADNPRERVCQWCGKLFQERTVYRPEKVWIDWEAEVAEAKAKHERERQP